MNTSTTTQNTTSTTNNTKGTTMNNSIVNFKVTYGSTCASVGGFFTDIISVPVNEILVTPVCRAIELFNSYAKTVGDIGIHFEDTLIFCQEDYYENNKSTGQVLIKSGLDFCKIISSVYPVSKEDQVKEFLQVNSFSISTPSTTNSKGTSMNTQSNNNQGTTMSTITFEQAVYNRIQTCKTWNVNRLRTVVREMWTKEDAIKSETTGEFLKKFFSNFESELKAKRFNFFDTAIVLGIYNRTWESHIAPKVDYIKDVIETPIVEKPTYQVFVYTDGSCNVAAKTGGWGVHMLVKGYPKYSKDFSGAEEGTTNNLMELRAMIQAIKSIDFTKEGFVFNIITDSKYVLQTLANQEKYEKETYKKVSNPEMVKELFQAVEDKGIVFDSFTRPVMSNTSIQSGDVVHIANRGKINFIWIKGHSDNMGNDKADKLALNARKQLDKASKEESEVITPEVIQEPSIESVDSSSVELKVVTKQMIEEAKTFEDIKHIISLSEDLNLGGTCGEDFTYYTKVLHKGKSVFEIVSPERVSSREGYIKSAANQLVKYLKEEGIYSDSNSIVDSVSSVEVTPSDLEAVVEYNKLNSTHDFTYMMSDDSRSYAAGLKSDKVLAAIEKTLSPLQLDLVALYNNYCLGRNCEQFRKSTTILRDVDVEAIKHYSAK